MAIRKDANTLSATERAEFVNAVKALKAEGVYDIFVRRHANTPMTDIHRASAFLPWHRRFIWDFERELQRVSGNPDLGLPYWNWPVGGATASLWNDDLLGGDGDSLTGVVRRGPFREGEWQVIDSSGNAAGPLTRAFGRTSAAARTLPSLAEIEQVLAVTPYDSPPWAMGASPSFRDELEGWTGPNLHNRGHVWVGGSMLPMTSPNDPVFFMHHCMVDKLWHEWQLRFPGFGYLPVSGAAFGQNLNDPMAGTPAAAIGSRPIDVLDSAALGIEYDQLLPGTPSTSPPAESEAVLVLGAAATEGNIANPGEIDRYRFDVAQLSQITIQTTGASDTLMELYGPDDATRQIAFNDDGGENFNARISMSLSAGTYFASVRLFDPSRTGVYGIAVANGLNTGGGGGGGSDIPALMVDAPPTDAAIDVASESDLYRFSISNPGSYTIQTSGSTDTFVTLFGPNSQSTQIASDDDSGPSLNARITATLNAGEYFVSVRHFSAFATGPYQIRVSQG